MSAKELDKEMRETQGEKAFLCIISVQGATESERSFNAWKLI